MEASLKVRARPLSRVTMRDYTDWNKTCTVGAPMSNQLAGSPIAHELRPWVAHTVRIGYAAKGVIYLLIGTLAFRLAAGLDGGRIVDPTGALRVIVRQPFGVVMLATAAIGILAYSTWQFIEAIWDTRGKGGGWRGWSKRGLRALKGAAYASVGWQAARMVMGGRGSRNPKAVAADVISFPLGDVFLLLVGLGVAVYGIFEVTNGWRSRFGDDLDSRRLRREAGGWAIHLGRIGHGARGVILTTMGVALVTAALQRDPSEAGGVAGALSTLFDQPYGKVLAGCTAAGLACFGLFQVLQARYAKL
jgi:hypothetical protein